MKALSYVQAHSLAQCTSNWSAIPSGVSGPTQNALIKAGRIERRLRAHRSERFQVWQWRRVKPVVLSDSMKDALRMVAVGWSDIYFRVKQPTRDALVKRGYVEVAQQHGVWRWRLKPGATVPLE